MNADSTLSKLLYTAAIAAAVASGTCTYTSIDKIVSANQAIEQTSAYQSKRDWKQAKNAINSASYDLSYSGGKSSHYPSPTYAKEKMGTAIGVAQQYNDEGMTTRLSDMKTRLPEGKRLRKLDGKWVNHRTFSSERNELGAEYRNALAKVKYYDSKIPAEYKSERTDGYLGLSGSLAAMGIASALLAAGKKKSIDGLRERYVPIDSN